MKKIGGFMAMLFLFFTLSLPIFVHAVKEDVPGGTGIVYYCVDGNCDFNDLIAAVKLVVNWASLFALAFSVVVIVVAGARYMMSGGNAGERTKANKMLFSVVKGIVFILAAWLIVTLITNALVNPANITPLLQ